MLAVSGEHIDRSQLDNWIRDLGLEAEWKLVST